MQPGELAELVGNAVLAHPAVVRLDGGPHGVLATHAPGRRVVGVHLDVDDDGPTGPVAVAVVLRYGQPLLEVVDTLREIVRSVVGAGVAVDVTVSDVVTGPVSQP